MLAALPAADSMSPAALAPPTGYPAGKISGQESLNEGNERRVYAWMEYVLQQLIPGYSLGVDFAHDSAEEIRSGFYRTMWDLSMKLPLLQGDLNSLVLSKFNRPIGPSCFNDATRRELDALFSLEDSL